MSNVEHGKISIEEQIVTLEQMVKEMKMSGYDRKATREIMVAGMIGWKRKILRRKTTGMYRSAKSTLNLRCRKKLLEKTSWYKAKRKREEDDFGLEDDRRGKKLRKNDEVKEEKKEKKVKAVLFVPYTCHSGLAKKLREAEEKLADLTGYKLKIVERAGTKLVDLLTKSNPWQGADCLRGSCMLCESKEKTGKNKGQDCHKRSCVYEIWCLDCEKEEEDRIDRKYSEEQKIEMKEQIRKEKAEIRRYSYIGETARSIFERSWEHNN